MGGILNLEDDFIEYQIITLNIIKSVRVDEYEKLAENFHKRQLILDNINNTDYSKEELKNVYFKYEIESLEKTLESEMKVKRKALLKKMRENKKRQKAMIGYNSISAKAVFLSKEV